MPKVSTLRTACCLWLLLTPLLAHSATYYLAASGGSNSHPCSESQPCASFSTALPLLRPGDTLILKAGTYTQNLKIGSPPVTSGRADAWITVKGEAPGAVTLKPSGIEGATINGNTQYWQLEDLTWDCSGLSNPGTGANCVSINWRPGPQESPEATSHMALRRIAITKTANPPGDHSTGIQAFANDVTIEDFSIDGTSIQAGDWQGSHCMYVNGSRQLIRRGTIRNCGGYGIQRNDTDMTWTQGNRGNQIVDVRIEDSGRRSSGGRGCLTLYHNQQGVLVAGVTCVNSRSTGMLIEGNQNSGHILAHNTIVGSAVRCLVAGSDASHPATDLTIQNTICASNAQGMKLGLYATGSSVVANILSDQTAPESSAGDTARHGNLVEVDPQFVDPSAGNYQPKATSPACNAGEPITGVTRDRRGRGAGREPTIGALPCVGQEPQPPDPPQPPSGGLTLACEGIVESIPGSVQMSCVQQTGWSHR